MQTIRAICFDIGDTLVFDDPPLRDRFQAAMEAAGLPCPASLFPAAYRAGEKHAIVRYLEGLPFDTPHVLRECADHIIAALRLPPLTEPQWNALAQSFASMPFTRSLHPHALGLIEILHGRGFRIGAVSDWEATLPDLLAELALASHLDALAVSALVGVTKPNPLLFQTALQQLGIPPHECLHIGDWYELDVAGARAAGMSALLFDHACRAPHADCSRVETFAQLADFLLSLPVDRGRP